MPHPVAFRSDQRKPLIDALLAGATYRDATAAAGIKWRTWCDWTKAHRAGGHPDPDVDGLVRDARIAYAKASTAMVAQVRVAGAKDWRAAAWILEHRQGDPKARHDEKRARYEAEIARRRASGEHHEKIDLDLSADDDLARRLAGLVTATGRDPSEPDTR